MKFNHPEFLWIIFAVLGVFFLAGCYKDAWVNIFPKNHDFLQKNSFYCRLNFNKSYAFLFPIGFLISILLVASEPLWQKTSQKHESSPVILVVDAHSPYAMRHVMLHDILEQLPSSSIGIIAFAGSAHVIVPLTNDREVLDHLQKGIDADIMPVSGYDPQAGIRLARQLFESSLYKQGRIILITHQNINHKINNLLSNTNFSLSILHIPVDSIQRPILKPEEINSQQVIWVNCNNFIFPFAIICFLLTCRQRRILIAGIFSMILGLQGDFNIAYANNKKLYITKQEIIYKAEKSWREKKYVKSAYYFGKINTADGYYNQGNALAKAYLFNESLCAFNLALQLNSQHEEALFNYKIVKKILKLQNSNSINFLNTSTVEPSINDLKYFLKKKLAIEWKLKSEKKQGFKYRD